MTQKLQRNFFHAAIEVWACRLPFFKKARAAEHFEYLAAVLLSCFETMQGAGLQISPTTNDRSSGHS